MQLSIIIVNWNAGPLLRRCLDALPAACAREGRRIDAEVFVVDNASRDGSVAEAKKSAQSFELQALPTNIGFARANNRALARARGEILLLLNPDTEPRPGSLVALVAAFRDHPRAGVVGGKLLNPDGSVQASVRQFPTALVLLLLLTRLARLFPNVPTLRRYHLADFGYDREVTVDQVMGACFAIRRETLDAVGPLDEGYRMWFEEVDYCRRVWTSGREVWFTPAAAVVHHRATAFRQRSPLWRAWQFSRSALRYARKHLGRAPAILVLLAVPVSLVTGLAAAGFGGVVRRESSA